MPTPSASPASAVKKIIVAVHGIGDQVRNETALATTIRFCDFYAYPGMVPLGAFYGALEHGQPAVVINDPPVRPGLSGELGFAEVYWADVARRISTERYTLQETKAWARSVVNRFRVLADSTQGQNSGIDYRRIRMVLEEMIQTIGVLEALLFLGRKAGLVDFNLRELLDAFLGDVQLMAEFGPLRTEVLGRFHQTLAAVGTTYPEAEIHVVAHSEGTVVSWLGLLEACDDPRQHPWIRRVRGFMTLGSPIDKHLILWPGLFRSFTGPAYQPASPADRIRWINYADYADPVGFELDTARDWIEQHGYQQAFAFDAKDDFAFGRYYLPGKAHVDYWNDAEVFGHFIRRVVAPSPAPSAEEKKRLADGPPGLWTTRVVSYGAGYLLPLIVLMVGTYFLYKNVGDYLHPDDTDGQPGLLRNVLVLGGLLAGTTVWLRFARLTRSGFWFFLGTGLYAVAGLIFHLAIDARTPEFAWLETLPAKLHCPAGTGTLLVSVAFVAFNLLLNSRDWRRLLGLGTPRHDGPGALKQMIWTAGLALAATIAFAASPEKSGPLWPVLLAGAGFLYLWWLAALLFDLVFVWHRYIRHAVALEFLRDKITGTPPSPPAK